MSSPPEQVVSQQERQGQPLKTTGIRWQAVYLSRMRGHNEYYTLRAAHSAV
ncbi:hypothetical protein [Hymenobacter sediminicola]|uniref:Uncharacterized protein n=1 Tax=Hymenobacter sediminicola TaxID=2761579 RepID=A0A7G7W9G1_9BACT|nr:hypothetical protein [Hymenobacter sediminicola]QNH63004.1 hypothetical protein H4317_04120 [Hymenobacter sediminicola]